MINFLPLAFVVFNSTELEFAPKSDTWMTLDREIETLVQPSLIQQGNGFGIEGFIRSSLAHSTDVNIGGNDLTGFSLDDVRLKAVGETEEFGVLVELEGSNDDNNARGVVGKGGAFQTGVFGGTGGAATAALLDAYAEWYFHDQYTLTVGQFRPWTFHDSQLDPIDQMFIDRSWNSEWWAFRDTGVMVTGEYDQTTWYAGIQNGGNNSAGEDLAFFGRAEHTPMGIPRDDFGSGVGTNGEETNLTLGIGYYDDGELRDGEFISADGELQVGRFTVVAEFGDYGDNLLGGTGRTMWSLAGAYMLAPDEWEVALRHEDLDDIGNNDSITTIGLNHYVSGHNQKFQVNLSQVDRQNDLTVLQVGMAIGI